MLATEAVTRTSRVSAGLPEAGPIIMINDRHPATILRVDTLHPLGLGSAENPIILARSRPFSQTNRCDVRIGLVIALRALVERAGLPVPVAVAVFIADWFLPAGSWP
jgi:hypothetical protein